MKRNLRWIFLGMMSLLLVFLYFISSTNIFFTEKDQRVYNISVILDETSEQNYAQLRLGMERGMEEENVDLNFITLQHSEEVEEQLQRIQREEESGADALIILPIEKKEIEDWLNNQGKIPVVSLGTNLNSSRVKGSVSYDEDRAGTEMMKTIRGDGFSGRVLMVMRKDREEKYLWKLKELEKDISLIEYKEGRLEEALRGAEEEITEDCVFLGMDDAGCEALLDLKKEQKLSQNIYGFGSSEKIFYHLNEGYFQAISGERQYEMGYLGVKKAVDILKGNKTKKDRILTNILVKPEEVYGTEIEKIIFPVN